MTGTPFALFWAVLVAVVGGAGSLVLFGGALHEERGAFGLFLAGAVLFAWTVFGVADLLTP